MRRRIPRSHGLHVTGFHPIRPGHSLVQFESALECAFLDWLCAFGGLPTITSQPIQVSWLDDRNQWRKYTPDFLVQYQTDCPSKLGDLGFSSQTIVEIKYSDHAAQKLHEIEKKLDAVRGQGYLALLLTEKEILEGRNE